MDKNIQNSIRLLDYMLAGSNAINRQFKENFRESDNTDLVYYTANKLRNVINMARSLDEDFVKALNGETKSSIPQELRKAIYEEEEWSA